MDLQAAYMCDWFNLGNGEHIIWGLKKLFVFIKEREANRLASYSQSFEVLKEIETEGL